jgi:hypothetical protein
MQMQISLRLFLPVTIALLIFSFLPFHSCMAVSWTVEVVDTKAELERISLALDSNDRPHMVYAATPSGNSFSNPTPEYLVYASWNGSGWSTQIVDENAYPGYNSLAFDSKDIPHIVYSTNDHIPFSTDNRTYHYSLRYATLNITHWTIMTIDDGLEGSITVDSKGNPQIAYAENNGLLKYASWTGLNWTTQTVDSTFLRPQKLNGEITASQYLTLDGNDNPCIVYGNDSTVKIAKGNFSGWSIETVVLGESITLGNIVLDSRGYPHFTYSHFPFGSAIYESWNGSAWTAKKLADSVYAVAGTFARLNSKDIPHATYISSSTDKVYYAVWNGTGWENQLVDSHSYIAYRAPLALDSRGNPHICYLTGRGTGDQYRFFADGTLMYATSNQPTQTLQPSPSIPEFSLWTILALLTTGIIVAAVFKRRN